MSYVYPSSDFDKKHAAVYILGTHWANTYAGQGTLLAYLRGRLELEKQTLNRAELAEACVSRQNTPIYETRRWQLLTLRQSELNSVKTSVLKYGDGAVYGYQTDGRLYLYGIPVASKYAFPVPADVKLAPIASNRVTDASLNLFSGVDYVIDETDASIIFRENPFDNPLWSVRDILDEDGIADKELAVWLFRPALEADTLTNHWGYALGMDLPSTDNYKTLINTTFDALVQGTSKYHTASLISAVLDVPLAFGTETVETIFTDGGSRFICTDANVYKYSDEAEPLVAVGDEVSAGDPLTDAFQVYELNRGVVPADLLALTMGRGLLSFGYFGGITFENKIVDLVVTTDDDGYTRVEFEVGGFTADVEQFWDQLHEAGVASGTTLANLLDIRTGTTTTVEACDITETTDSEGEPGAASLPATINPLEFLIQNVLRNNACIVKIRAAALGENSLDLKQLEVLRKLVPPHTVIIFLVEIEVPEDVVLLSGAGTEAEPGYTEEVGTFAAAAPIEEVVDETYVDDSLCHMRYVYGRCI